MIRLWAIIICCLWASISLAQETRTQLNNYNQSFIIENGRGAITGDILQVLETNIINSTGNLSDTNNWTGVNIFPFSGVIVANGTNPITSLPFNAANGIPTLDSSGNASAFPVISSKGTVARTLSALFGDWINIKDYGAVGNGVNLDGGSIQAAFTAASSGGRIDAPCGTYKITQNIAQTLANYAHLKVNAGGSDCTEFWFSGGAYGATINWANQFASVDFSGLSITTDQSGTGTGLRLNITTAFNGVNEFGSNNFYDVTFRGHDRYTNPSATTEYWATAFYNNGPSNLNFWGGTCEGPQEAPGGICYSLNGPSDSIQSVVVNFWGTVWNYCNIGVFYGPDTQGVALNTINTVGCNYGVETTSATNGPAQLSMINSQLNSVICGVCIEDAIFPTVQISNNVFNMSPGSIGIKLRGLGHTITGNSLSHAGGASGTGILIASSSGNGAGSIIANNQIGSWSDGIKVADGVTAYGYANYNNMVFNSSDYTLGGSYNYWAVSTAYVLGANIVTNIAGNYYIYRETVSSCTSASSGNGPSGTGSSISDGTCNWSYVAPGSNGYALWATSTTYTSGAKVVTNVANNLYIYTQTVSSCTSASTGSGPTGAGTTITDNSCSWNYVSTAAQGLFINDNNPKNLSGFLGCTYQIKRSALIQADNNLANSWGGVATGGGGQLTLDHCDGSAWRNG